jgi:hypothetical protein
MILLAWSVDLSSADLYQDQVMLATGRGEALPLCSALRPTWNFSRATGERKPG